MLVKVVEAAKGALGPATVELLDAQVEVHQLVDSLEGVKGGPGYRLKLQALLQAAQNREAAATKTLDARKAEYQRLQALVSQETTDGIRKDKQKYDAVVEKLDPAKRAMISSKAAALVNRGAVPPDTLTTVNDGHRFVKAKVLSYDAAEDTCQVLVYSESLGAGWYTEGYDVARTLPRSSVYYAADVQQPMDDTSKDLVDQVVAVLAHAQTSKPVFDEAVLTMLGGNGAAEAGQITRTGSAGEDSGRQNIITINNGALTIHFEVKSAPVKRIERATIKMFEKYDANPNRVLDLARTTIECDTLEAIEFVFDRLSKSEVLEVVRLKDRMSAFYDSMVSGGYRDFLLNVRCATGHVCELQITLRDLLQIKEGGSHGLYRLVRLTNGLAPENATYNGAFSADVAHKVEHGMARYLEILAQSFEVAKFTSSIASKTSHIVSLELYECPCLKGISLHKNILPEKVVRALAPSIQTVVVEACMVSGQFPTLLAECRQLKKLSFRYEKGLQGEVPAHFWELPRLEHVDFNKCHLSGVVSAVFWQKQLINVNLLRGPKFTGAFPADSPCTSLRGLALGSNLFEGTIPKWLGNNTQLRALHLYNSETFDTTSPAAQKTIGTRTSPCFVLVACSRWLNRVQSAWPV